MTAHGRTQLAHDERLPPTPKMRSDEQLIVLRAACASTDSFVDGARLAAATGLDKKKCGLVPAFLFSSGLGSPPTDRTPLCSSTSATPG